MTQSEIIAMAREAGGHELLRIDGAQDSVVGLSGGAIIRFAALVAAREREACAKVCESESARAVFNFHEDLSVNQQFWNGGSEMTTSCAASIRARSARLNTQQGTNGLT